MRAFAGATRFQMLFAFGLLTQLIAGVARAGDEPTRVPLRRVVLFTSGVGFFERLAEIDGDVRIDLQFKTDDINDLLQSMVLQDFGGGAIAPVTYASKEPLTRTLETFRIDLTSDPTLADLLAQIRGERVRVEAPDPTEGVIVGVELNVEQIKDRAVEVKTLNLLTGDGLTGIRLSDVRRIKLLNEKLDDELRRALAILAAGQAVEKKEVTLNFQGQGKRTVRVAYIQESPIWKTSYRLVLRKDEKPLLQGWAIVDNTTEEDWDGVSLTLVSGRPISFVMDLYQSLFVFRPKVQPELFAGLRPQTHDQDLAAGDAEFRAKLAASAFGGPQGGPRAAGVGGIGGGGMGGAGMTATGLGPASLDPSQGVPTAATAGDVGELFQYAIKMPITLARRKSAMLPIVNATVKAEKLSLYSPQSQQRHPLNALEFTNSTDLHLMQGPITVFDDNVYAGNARILDLPPGGKRLVSYALDLETEISEQSADTPEQPVSVRLAKGVALVTHEQRRKHKYIVKNSGDAAKRVLIEQPIDVNWELALLQEPAEKTRNLYRFALEAEPGKPAELIVEEKRVTRQEVAVRDLGERIEVLVKSNAISDRVKKALGEVAKREQALADIVQKRQTLEKLAREITAEQGRIRANLGEVDKNSELYRRYIRKLTSQEDELEAIGKQVKTLEADEVKKRDELGEFILGLDLD